MNSTAADYCTRAYTHTHIARLMEHGGNREGYYTYSRYCMRAEKMSDGARGRDARAHHPHTITRALVIIFYLLIISNDPHIVRVENHYDNGSQSTQSALTQHDDFDPTEWVTTVFAYTTHDLFRTHNVQVVVISWLCGKFEGKKTRFRLSHR